MSAEASAGHRPPTIAPADLRLLGGVDNYRRLIVHFVDCIESLCGRLKLDEVVTETAVILFRRMLGQTSFAEDPPCALVAVAVLVAAKGAEYRLRLGELLAQLRALRALPLGSGSGGAGAGQCADTLAVADLERGEYRALQLLAFDVCPGTAVAALWRLFGEHGRRSALRERAAALLRDALRTDLPLAAAPAALAVAATRLAVQMADETPTGAGAAAGAAAAATATSSSAELLAWLEGQPVPAEQVETATAELLRYYEWVALGGLTAEGAEGEEERGGGGGPETRHSAARLHARLHGCHGSAAQGALRVAGKGVSAAPSVTAPSAASAAGAVGGRGRPAMLARRGGPPSPRSSSSASSISAATGASGLSGASTVLSAASLARGHRTAPRAGAANGGAPGD